MTIAREREIFGRNLRRARKEAGFSQREVYERTGLAQSYVSQVERGRANISLDTMVCLAELVGRDIRSLVAPSEKG